MAFSRPRAVNPLGFLRRDPTKPRAMEVRFDAMSGGAIERRPGQARGLRVLQPPPSAQQSRVTPRP